MANRGKLIIFSAPSGSGKSTLIAYLMQQGLPLSFSVSATSRAPRGTEQHGKEYYFLSEDEFRSRIAADDFLEYEEVYPGKFYGTLKSEVERLRNAGRHVIFDVDVVGGVNIKQFYQDEAMSVFIQPPSVEVLRERLVGRATDAPEVIATRVAKAEQELTYAPKFDKIVVNDVLEEAQKQVLALVEEFINR
ncbi:MAG: guanylate kinase [Bacteroidaceae bacterium]|nr:guanylate kinase [Bacteroidaceae bacterium]